MKGTIYGNWLPKGTQVKKKILETTELANTLFSITNAMSKLPVRERKPLN